MENDIGIDTKFKSEKTTFHIKGYQDYAPSNANNKYANRPINMEEAFATSDNILTISPEIRDILRANIFKNMLFILIFT